MLKTTPDRIILPLSYGYLWYIDLEFTTTNVDSTGKASKDITDKQFVDVDWKKLNEDPKYKKELDDRRSNPTSMPQLK